MSEYKTHYDFESALYAIGIKSRFKRMLFVLYKRHDLTLCNLKMGIGFNRLCELMDGLTPSEKRFFGVKYERRI